MLPADVRSNVVSYTQTVLGNFKEAGEVGGIDNAGKALSSSIRSTSRSSAVDLNVQDKRVERFFSIQLQEKA